MLLAFIVKCALFLHTISGAINNNEFKTNVVVRFVKVQYLTCYSSYQESVSILFCIKCSFTPFHATHSQFYFQVKQKNLKIETSKDK